MRLTRRIVSWLICPLLVATGFTLAPPATAAAKASDGATFNDPLVGSKRYALTRHVRALIKRTPGASSRAAGATIHVAMYTYSSAERQTVDALVRAARRGVSVRLLLDSDKTLEPGYTRYASFFRGLQKKYPTFKVSFCPIGRGCIGNAHPDSNNHNKFFLFSRTDGTDRVVVQSSANLTRANSVSYWNNAVTLANPGLYADYLAYFDDLWQQQPTDDYGRVAVSGNAKAWHFPMATGDPVAETLNSDVDCTGNSIVGYRGRSIVRVAMKDFYRSDVAEALWSLADRGCRVEVAYNEPSALQPYRGQSAAVVAALRRAPPPPPARVRLFVAGPPARKHPQRRLIHSKYLLIEGGFEGRADSKVVFTGSHNFSCGSLRDNDETQLRVTRASLHDQFRANFTRISSTLD